MCGICGILNFDRRNPVSRPVLESMNRQIAHRGPDDQGFYVSDNVGLAMRRLSIIDLQTGQQPISNEDGTVWIVFNGEIYNYRELRQGLLAGGHRLRTHSDTETIVHLYEEYGHDCVRHLRGMFAFVIWDAKRRRLLAARDRLGIKPFYYRQSKQNFIFASEIKALLEFPGVQRELNRAALPEYLAFGYLSGPETFFSGIHKLAAGHTLELDEQGNARLQQYWDLPQVENEEDRPERYYVQGYRDLLEECVASHLMSDVPLGVFLSGGLDSSAVAALTTKIRRQPIETFSVGYAEEAFSELGYARQVSEHLGSIHHEVRVGRHDFFDALPHVIWHEDEPVVWPSSIALYFVAKLARERVVVVLTGEGSDETLAGYSRYALTLWNSRFDSVYRPLAPAAVARALRRLLAGSRWLNADLRRKLEHTFLARNGSSWTSFYFDNFLSSFAEPEQAEVLLDPPRNGEAYREALRFWEKSTGPLLSRLLYTDIKTYLVELLMKQDQMSMAASVESRVPFLDHVLVEFAARVPGRCKVRGLAGKRILKLAMRGVLPPAIIGRRKMGFPTPWRAWLAGPSYPEIENLLLSPRSLERKIFKPEAVRRLLGEHRDRYRDHSDRLWRLLNLEIWQRVFFDRDPELLRALPEPAARSVHR